VLLNSLNFQENWLNFKLFEFFLNQLGIESELNIQREGSNSEYSAIAEKTSFVKSSEKYTIHSSISVNEFRFQKTYWENLETAWFWIKEYSYVFWNTCCSLVAKILPKSKLKSSEV